jgi:hypothetical protein
MRSTVVSALAVAVQRRVARAPAPTIEHAVARAPAPTIEHAVARAPAVIRRAVASASASCIGGDGVSARLDAIRRADAGSVHRTGARSRQHS